MTTSAFMPENWQPTLNDAIAEEVRVRLAAKRISNKALAERLHISHGQVTQRLKGTVEWKLGDIEMAASLLGFTYAFELVKRAEDNYQWIQSGHGNPWTHGDPQDPTDVWCEVKGWEYEPLAAEEVSGRTAPGGGSRFVLGSRYGIRDSNPEPAGLKPERWLRLVPAARAELADVVVPAPASVTTEARTPNLPIPGFGLPLRLVTSERAS